MTQRKVCIGGNWKCNGTKAKVVELTTMLNEFGAPPSNVDVVIAPPSLHVGYLVDNLRKDFNVSVQNLWNAPKAGAWTGEITVDLVKDFGVNWTILGHSERRKYNMESSELIAEKTKIAIASGIKVIACIGESLQDRETGKTMDVCVSQLDPIIKALSPADWKQVVVAYEPVWAIGTGKTASPQQAQDTHKELRNYLKGKLGGIADELSIIYGGSVKGSNCKELITQPDIDGFLVGGASLKKEFQDIIMSASHKSKM